MRVEIDCSFFILFSKCLLNQYIFPCSELFSQHSEEMTTLSLLQPERINKKFVAHSNLCAFISLQK